RLRTEAGGRVERAPRTAGIAGPVIHANLNSLFNRVSNARYQSTVAEDRSQVSSWSSGGAEIADFICPFSIFLLTAHVLSVT
ncbi:MAG TPA: hypothetical protein VH575_31900, partial [Gemmataceae bacterium]